jgi:hypothetical protein
VKRTLLILSVISASLWCNLTAQPQLNFKRIINNWPTIELYFITSCNGQRAFFTDKRDFKVMENGIEIRDIELWCPDPTAHCSISVSLVFDASDNMMGKGNAGAKAAGNAFVDLMDGTVDEATVVWFDSTARIRQNKTTSKNLLHAAIDSLPVGGKPALWDGVHAGLLDLINNGVNPCRAVIILTNGKDIVSRENIDSNISLANRNRIRIFTIGLGDSIDAAQLDKLANLTGGRYYESLNFVRIKDLWNEISPGGDTGFQECIITYRAKCMDGTRRTVDLSLVNFCGGSDTKTKTFKALRDTSTFTSLRIRPGKKEAGVSKSARIPLELLDPIGTDFLYPATWTLTYDTTCARFAGIETPPGSLLEGVPIAITRIAGGVTFQTMERKLVNVASVPAVMAELKFETKNPGGKDTIRCPLKLTNWRFEAGCYKPVLQDGEIMILPGVSDAGEAAAMKRVFEIGPIYPNPAGATVLIPFSLSERALVRIHVFDALGREVRAFADEMMEPGSHSVIFNAAGLPPGVYLCRMEAGRNTASRKMIIAY